MSSLLVKNLAKSIASNNIRKIFLKSNISKINTFSINNSQFSKNYYVPVLNKLNSLSISKTNTINRFIHTAGDRDLSLFLEDEIKLEKGHSKSPIEKIKGFEVTKIEGPNVVLTKKVDKETITIKFNVNNTIEDSLVTTEHEAKEDQQENNEMVSRPPFVVEIDKGGDHILAIHCVFPSHEDSVPEQAEHEEAYDDLIEIQDVALLKKSQEWTDDVYSLSGTVMDGNLYDMLLKFLEERGIDGEFLDHLIEWSTTYEHNKYIGLLENLKVFVGSK